MPTRVPVRLSRRSFSLLVFSGLTAAPSVLAQEATPQPSPSSPVATPTSTTGLIPMWTVDGSNSNHHPGPMPVGALAQTGTIAPGVRLFGRVLVTPDHLVALGADDDLNWVLDRASGERLWSFPSTNRSVEPFIHDNRVFSVTESYDEATDSRLSHVEFYGLEAGSPTSWEIDGIEGLLGMIPVRDAILVRTGDGLVAYHPATADPLWNWLDEERSDFITDVLADDREVWVSQWRMTGSRIIALDVTTGNPRLEFDSAANLVCMTPDILLTREEVVLAGFDRTDGSLLWQVRLPGTPDDDWAVATNGEFIVVGTGGDLLAFHASSGEAAWIVTGATDLLQQDQLVICDQSVIFPSDDYVVVIDLHTGELVQRLSIGARNDSPLPREVSIVDEQILVSSSEGIAVITGGGTSSVIPVSPIQADRFISPGFGVQFVWNPDDWSGNLAECAKTEIVELQGVGNNAGTCLIQCTPETIESVDEFIDGFFAGVSGDPDAMDSLTIEHPGDLLHLPAGFEARLIRDEDTDGLMAIASTSLDAGSLWLMWLTEEPDDPDALLPYLQQLFDGYGPAPDDVEVSCP